MGFFELLFFLNSLTCVIFKRIMAIGVAVWMLLGVGLFGFFDFLTYLFVFMFLSYLHILVIYYRRDTI